MKWPNRPDGHTPDKTGHPWEPWLTREAIGVLEETLTPASSLFEFGAGASTVWYAKRCKIVNAIEHDPSWVNAVTNALTEEGLATRVNFGSSDNNFEHYLIAAKNIMEMFGPYDVVIVDGRCRVKSVAIAAPHVRPGGLLLLDNAERTYYREVHSILSGWDLRETSNGIWRTDIYRKNGKEVDDS